MVYKWFLWFILYSFIGWVYESTVISIQEKKMVNRGFLNGPVCPVYGFGALVSIAVLYHQTDNFIALFFAGMLLTITVEYLTAVLLEKLFHAKWWDYSNYRFNFQGRVSLIGAFVFGMLSALLVKYIHPFVEKITDQLPADIIFYSSVVFFILLSLDIFVTVRHLLLLNGRLQEIQSVLNCFLDQYAKRAGELKNSLLDKFEESEFFNDHIKSLFKLNSFQNHRIVRAFPKLRSIKYEDALHKLKSTLLGKNKTD